MMAKRLVFKVAKSNKINERESMVMRVTGGFYNLVQELANETNLPKVEIINRITEFVTDYIDITEVDND